jgi:hypothetical protein
MFRALVWGRIGTMMRGPSVSAVLTGNASELSLSHVSSAQFCVQLVADRGALATRAAIICAGTQCQSLSSVLPPACRLQVRDRLHLCRMNRMYLAALWGLHQGPAAPGLTTRAFHADNTRLSWQTAWASPALRMKSEPPASSTGISRRNFQVGLTQSLLGASFLAALPDPLLAVGVDEADQFYAKWPFSRPQDVLPYIYATAERGNVDSIIAALDKFGEFYPNYRLGADKGRIVEEKLAGLPRKPKVALEIGTFWGYSAIRTARHLADDGTFHVHIAVRALAAAVPSLETVTRAEQNGRTFQESFSAWNTMRTTQRLRDRYLLLTLSRICDENRRPETRIHFDVVCVQRCV